MEKIDNLTGIYQEIAQITNVETAIKMHNLFKGQQITFPQRLYNIDFIRSYVKENYDGHNIRELSQKFGLSDRRIRQIIKEGGTE